MHIVLNRNATLAGPLVEMTEKAYPGESLFISPLEALHARHRTFAADRGGYPFGEFCGEPGTFGTGSPMAVVIDHHRMMVTRIKNALIFYHEPYASSASEMVTELAQYIKASAIDGADAQALLAGIMLDTKNFVLKTGVRTFEASAFLRRRGADPVAVEKAVFRFSLESYKQKAQLVSGSEDLRRLRHCHIQLGARGFPCGGGPGGRRAVVHHGCAGLRCAVPFQWGREYFRPQPGRRERAGDRLEEFGGGGHFTMAGAQLKNISIGDARRALIRELDDKLDESSVQN